MVRQLGMRESERGGLKESGMEEREKRLKMNRIKT